MKGWTVEYVQSLPDEVYIELVHWLKELSEAMGNKSDDDEISIDMDSDNWQNQLR